jgi:hypothetical protein
MVVDWLRDLPSSRIEAHAYIGPAPQALLAPVRLAGCLWAVLNRDLDCSSHPDIVGAAITNSPFQRHKLSADSKHDRLFEEYLFAAHDVCRNVYVFPCP